jgi:uncharacterized membrane protein YecN with MAPEG domain
MADMHVSLFSAAIAALITAWLGWRCGKVRMSEKILHGDGGNVLMMRRMRAQANFTEYTPIALVLIVLLDLMDVNIMALGLTALAFMLGRVLHAIGMDSDGPHKARMIGMMLTLPLLIVWAMWAILLGARLI